MSTHQKLGRIKKNRARDYWAHEEQDFTPWLADNIDLLGAEIGMELEREEQESSVGGFRVDLVCKDADERTVIIENQLEKTDHKHLGQLLTYAAGKKAAVVVWVAIEFTEEHRAALDWLNEQSDDDTHFFGVQIEVWQIGNSAPAPKFEVVCKPNEWAKVARHSDEMSDAQKLHFDFWRGLQTRMRDEGGKIAPRNPVKQKRRVFVTGSKRFRIVAVVRPASDFIAVRMVLRGGDAFRSACYAHLLQHKTEIEKEIGVSLTWRERGPKGNLALSASLHNEKCGVRDRENWDELHRWLHTHIEKFYAAFHARIQNLTLEDESESDEE